MIAMPTPEELRAKQLEYLTRDWCENQDMLDDLAGAHEAHITLTERRRCIKILEMHQEDLEAAGLWPRLWNLLHNGRDVEDPNDSADRSWHLRRQGR